MSIVASVILAAFLVDSSRFRQVPLGQVVQLLSGDLSVIGKSLDRSYRGAGNAWKRRAGWKLTRQTCSCRADDYGYDCMCFEGEGSYMFYIDLKD